MPPFVEGDTSGYEDMLSQEFIDMVTNQAYGLP